MRDRKRYQYEVDRIREAVRQKSRVRLGPQAQIGKSSASFRKVHLERYARMLCVAAKPIRAGQGPLVASSAVRPAQPENKRKSIIVGGNRGKEP